MKKTMILAAFAALVSLASCQKEEVIDNGADNNASPVFTASIAGATKTTIDVTDGKVAWETTDEITVTDASSASAIYTIKSIDETSGKATFAIKEGETALGNGPYTATYGTAPATTQTYSATAGKLYMTAPETSNNSFTFTVQCGLMKVNLTKTGESVKSIAVTGTPTGGSETTYTLTCTEAQSIASAKDFFIALPAGNYKKIEITNASDAKATLNSANGVDVAANHVKPVTLAGSKLDFIPEGALPGVFSVSDTQKIRFSKGNLQAEYKGNGFSWGFAMHQYDYIGGVEDPETETPLTGNNRIDSLETGDIIDLFCWPTDASNYGISTSVDDDDYSGDFMDWGKNIGDGNTWRTLSGGDDGEWKYLFTERPNAANLCRYNVTVCNKGTCLVLAPDDFKGTIEDSYDVLAWAAAEEDGLVCLPAAGVRINGTEVGAVGGQCEYWSSTVSSSSLSYSVAYFRDLIPVVRQSRDTGISVRLVTDVN